MTRWTEEAYDMLSGDGCDIIPDSLDNAIKTLLTPDVLIDDRPVTLEALTSSPA